MSKTMEHVVISGEDFSETDFEARQIMDHLAEHPTMPLRKIVGCRPSGNWSTWSSGRSRQLPPPKRRE
jgi:hypothetical protein